MHPLLKLLAKFGHSLGLPSKYKLVRQLGAGAEGEVWLAVDEEAQGWVAVKLIPRGAPAWQLDMVAREFRTLALLGGGPSHVNIARPLELVLTSKHLALITEYVGGGSLADLMGRQRLPPDLARYFFRQVAAALLYCHGRRVVYRDVKPANALVTATQPPFLKLCDFGLADSWEGRPGPLFNSLVGTPGYMAPEIMAAFFAGAEALARRSQEHAAAAAAAAAGKDGGGSAHGPAAPAGGGSDAGGGALDAAPKMVRCGSSQALSRAASGLAGKIAAAAQAAATSLGGPAAAVPAAGAGAGAAAESEDVEIASYDGEAADVFSLGVLLVVMMLRCMPWYYDAYASRLSSLDAMKRLYHTAVTQGVPWQAATPGADTLPPQLLRLLDAMLQPDPRRRATLRQVLDSEWVNEPLPPKLECALQVLQEQQELREATAADAGAADAAVPAARLAQLEAMLQAAKKVGKGLKLESHIVLTAQQQAPAARQRRGAAPQQPARQQQEQREQQQPASPPSPLSPLSPQQQDAAGGCLADEACIANIVAPSAAPKAAPEPAAASAATAAVAVAAAAAPQCQGVAV